jgi:hypothetical protein
MWKAKSNLIICLTKSLNVMIRNHAYQKLFSFIITHPSSLLPLPSPRIPDWYVVKLHPSGLSLYDWYIVKLHILELVRYDVKLHLSSLGPDAQYGTKLQPRTSQSPRQYR